MRAKIIVLLLGVLVFIQIILYTQIRKSNIDVWNQAIKQIDLRINTRENEIVEAEKEVKRLKKIKDKVPRAILEGVEDPEKKFVDFMDYLNKSNLKDMDGTFSIAAKPTIKYEPVPLQETEFEITFRFSSPKEIETFFDYLMGRQQDYPLMVRKLEIKRIPGQLPQVIMRIALMLPAKIKTGTTTG